MKMLLLNVLSKTKNIIASPYKYLVSLILLGYVNLSYGAGTDLLKAGDETVQATMGQDSTLVRWLLGAEVIMAIMIYIKTRTPLVFVGLLFVLVFTSVGFGLI